MMGKMQDWPLTVDKIMDHAARTYPDRRIITRSIEGPIETTTYGQLKVDAMRVSNALKAYGIKPGDRVATLAFNTDRHMAVWYGTMGLGSVLHTINPRLFPEQIVYIVNHAEDRMLFLDAVFAPQIDKLKALVPTIETYVVLCREADLPETEATNVISFEAFLDGAGESCDWGGFDENTPCGLCYTSGTTGNPKGVMYTHRSNVLHTFMTLQRDVLGIFSRDRVLPIVPMFHANAWGLAFSCPAVGAEMIMPGAKMDGASVYELLADYKVTASAAVPTVWLMLLQYMEANNLTLPDLNRVVIGGAAVPERVLRAFEEKFGVEVSHAWGMTETSPLGTVNSLPPEMDAADHETRIDYKLKQGIAPFGVELKLTNDKGEALPHDGETSGHLLVKGCAVVDTYFKGEDSALDEHGFFDTGDIATINRLGCMEITDRTKDVIKSGGEWISSIELENIAVGHPKVAAAAAIGIYHPKWDERPLLIIQLNEGETATEADILKHLEGKIAKWWTPDAVAFVDEIPLGATGKVNKRALRETFRDYKLPN